VGVGSPGGWGIRTPRAIECREGAAQPGGCVSSPDYAGFVLSHHAKKGSRWRGFDPENRDDRRRGERADHRDKILRHLASLEQEQLTAALARVRGDFPSSVAQLSTRRGPNRLYEEGPSQEAFNLAYDHALASLAPL
jgi:hypothetical protein